MPYDVILATYVGSCSSNRAIQLVSCLWRCWLCRGPKEAPFRRCWLPWSQNHLGRPNCRDNHSYNIGRRPACSWSVFNRVGHGRAHTHNAHTCVRVIVCVCAGVCQCHADLQVCITGIPFLTCSCRICLLQYTDRQPAVRATQLCVPSNATVA